MEEHDEFDGLIAFEDYTAIDAADYFAVTLASEFPGLDFEKYEPNDWRVGWHITVPQHGEYTLNDVQRAANYMRDVLYFQKDVLVPFTLNRVEGEDDDHENKD